MDWLSIHGVTYSLAEEFVLFNIIFDFVSMSRNFSQIRLKILMGKVILYLFYFLQVLAYKFFNHKFRQSIGLYQPLQL